MRRNARVWMLGVSLISGVWKGGLALAQDDPDLARAVELFEESEDLYNDGEFLRAAALLREAYDLHADPVLQFNLGRALESAGDLDGAIEAYARYIDTAPDAQDRGAIEQRLRTLRAQRDRLAASEMEEESYEADLSGEPRTERDVGGPSPLPFVLGGAGVAVVGVGLVFGLMSQSKHDDADAARVQLDAHDLQSDAETFAVVANVSFVAGAVMLAGAALWLVLDGGGDGEEDVAVGIGPGHVTLAGRF